MSGSIRGFLATATIILFSTLGVLAIGPASATSTWGAAQEVAAALNTDNYAIVTSISCSSAGNCSAAGQYRDSAGYQAFVVDEVNGTWGAAQEVAAALNTQNNASVYSISCSSAGNCSAAGQYRDSAGGQAFVVDETTPVAPTTTVPATVPATLAATGTNLTLPLGLAAVLVGLGGLGVLRLQRRQRGISSALKLSVARSVCVCHDFD